MIIATLISSPLVAVVYALTLNVLWRWFLLPLGLPELDIAHLYGVALVVSFVTTSTPKYEKNAKADVEEIIGSALMMLFRAVIALFTGWVALQLWGGA